MMARPSGYAQAIAAAALLSMPLELAAQQDGGAIGEFRYAEGLRWEDDELRSRSDLGFSYSSRTPSQYFLLDMFGGVDKFVSEDETYAIQDPRLSLDYGLETRDSALTTALDYRRTDNDRLVLDEDLPDPALVLDDGTREDLSARLGLELGREAPVGASMSLGYFTSTYSDTTSPLLTDDETVEGDLQLRFDVSPRISANTTLSFSDLNRTGGVDVRRDTFSVGAAMIISPVLEAQIDIGTTRVIQSGSVPRTVEEGPYLSLAATRIVQNGSVTGSLTSELDEYGRRNTLEVGRALELPAGSLSFDVGVSNSDSSSDLQPVYSLSYGQELPRGSFTIGASQRFDTDSVGNETLDSQLRMRLQQDLTARDRLSAELRVRNSDRTESVDTRFASIGFDYSRTLTEDWSFVSSFTHTRRTESGSEDADDIVFIGLSTLRLWRP